MRTPKIGEPVQYADAQSKLHAALIVRLPPTPSVGTADLRVFTHGGVDADIDGVKRAGPAPSPAPQPNTWRWLEEA